MEKENQISINNFGRILIPYCIRKGAEGKIIYLENDEEAKDIADFFNATKWERLTMLLRGSFDDIQYRIEIELGNNDLRTLGDLEIVDVKTWKAQKLELGKHNS